MCVCVQAVATPRPSHVATAFMRRRHRRRTELPASDVATGVDERVSNVAKSQKSAATVLRFRLLDGSVPAHLSVIILRRFWPFSKCNSLSIGIVDVFLVVASGRFRVLCVRVVFRRSAPVSAPPLAGVSRGGGPRGVAPWLAGGEPGGVVQSL